MKSLNSMNSVHLCVVGIVSSIEIIPKVGKKQKQCFSLENLITTNIFVKLLLGLEAKIAFSLKNKKLSVLLFTHTHTHKFLYLEVAVLQLQFLAKECAKYWLTT